MILTGNEIKKQVNKGRIIIDNFSDKQLNPNSYNVTLNNRIYVLEKSTNIDLKKRPDKKYFTEIQESGFILLPGQLYLGSTNERAGSNYYVPCLEGRSSMARIGLSVHITAGFGDTGFTGKWTLEMSSMFPTKIYPNIEIAQVYFMKPKGKITLYCGKYSGQSQAMHSKIHEEFI